MSVTGYGYACIVFIPLVVKDSFFIYLLQRQHCLAQSSFDHPSINLRSSFDWELEDDYWIYGG